MSKSKAIAAAEIIDRFGGIRPMATKTGVAVTTIQGWKKRDAIPAARRDMILKAAQDHDIDLSDILPKDGAGDQTPKPAAVTAVERPSPKDEGAETDEIKADGSKQHQDKDKSLTDIDHYIATEIEKKYARMEKRMITKTVAINAVLMGLAVGAAVVLFMPAADKETPPVIEEARVEAVERAVAEVQQEQKNLRSIVPQDLSQRLSHLQEEAVKTFEQTQEHAQNLQVKTQEFLENNEDWRARVDAIEEKISSVQKKNVLADLLGRYTGFTQSEDGQQTLSAAVASIASIIQSRPAEQSVDEALQVAQNDNAALSESFADVPSQDLKAAAILLTMAKLRSSLRRGNESFDQDYKVLRGLVNEDDAELIAALDRLSPHAQDGVLTPKGLGDELRVLTGDVVVASLSGEDISVKERAAARLNEVLSIRKDGELLTGTPTQAKINQAETLVAQGDIAGAIAQMQTIEGAAAELVAPWIGQAKAALLAQEVNKMLGRSMSKTAYHPASTSLQPVTPAADDAQTTPIEPAPDMEEKTTDTHDVTAPNPAAVDEVTEPSLDVEVR